jgi:hypothetical protein
LLGGLFDIFYINTVSGKRFRCRVDVMVHLQLYAYSKTIKQMSREEIFDLSVESREKVLIAYQFDRLNGQCSDIKQIGDNVVVYPVASHDQLMTNDLHFGFGVATVIDWGEISDLPGFHTKFQLYPVGFKCLRQELDIALDRIVDCLCEIDSHITYDSNNNEITAPLFRISICWVLDKAGVQKCNRVYEGKSPQLAWQAAMLETIGINDNQVLKIEENKDSNVIDSVLYNCMDEEEKMLRKNLMETRREYMRALHKAQVKL